MGEHFSADESIKFLLCVQVIKKLNDRTAADHISAHAGIGA